MFAAGIEELAEAYGAEEVIVVTITHDHQARRRSYELLAEVDGARAATAAGLEPQSAAELSRGPPPGSPRRAEQGPRTVAATAVRPPK